MKPIFMSMDYYKIYFLKFYWYNRYVFAFELSANIKTKYIIDSKYIYTKVHKKFPVTKIPMVERSQKLN